VDHYAQPITVEADVAGVPETPSPVANGGVSGLNEGQELVPQIGGEEVDISSVAGSVMQTQIGGGDVEVRIVGSRECHAGSTRSSGSGAD